MEFALKNYSFSSNFNSDLFLGLKMWNVLHPNISFKICYLILIQKSNWRPWPKTWIKWMFGRCFVFEKQSHSINRMSTGLLRKAWNPDFMWCAMPVTFTAWTNEGTTVSTCSTLGNIWSMKSTSWSGAMSSNLEVLGRRCSILLTSRERKVRHYVVWDMFWF